MSKNHQNCWFCNGVQMVLPRLSHLCDLGWVSVRKHLVDAWINLIFRRKQIEQDGAHLISAYRHKSISDFLLHLKCLYWSLRNPWICPLWLLHIELSSVGQCSLKHLLSLPWVKSCFSVEQLWSQALLKRRRIMSGPLGVPALLLWVSACLWLSWQAQGALIISGTHKSLVNHDFNADFISLFSPNDLIFDLLLSFFQSQEAHQATRSLQVFKLL